MSRQRWLNDMSSGRFAEVRTPLMLSILMVLMTQVGYLDLMNAWSGDEETLDDAEPVVAYSPSTSVMYGNNTVWTSTIGPIKHAEYIALAYDAVLFQAAPSKNSMKGCPMAYNASNATVWQPNLGSTTTTCGGMVGRYVAMVDDITYFTFVASSSWTNNGLAGDLYAYNPANDTIYLISSHNNQVKTGVAVGRTLYFTSGASTSMAFNAYNVDNQTAWTLSSPTIPSGTTLDRLMVVGSKILTHSATQVMGSEAFNTENNTWYSVPSLPSKGFFGDPAPGLVSNGQLLFVGTDAATVASSTSGNGSEYWIYDSNNDTAWPLGDFCVATACNGGLPFYEDDGLPQIRDGTDMYFIARSYDSSTSNPSNGDTMYNLWGYSTLNATTWHMTNLTATFNNVGSYNTTYDHQAHIKLAMLANGDFVISSSMAHPSPTYESAFYSPTNDTIWQPTLCSSCGNSQGTSGVDAQYSRLLGVYGNTVYFARYGTLLAYNMENQTAASQIIPGADTSYLNGAPVLFGSTFAMAHHCGDGTASSCPNGQRNTLLQWAPEYVTVSDAWNLTPGQRIDGPITGGNGIHTSSGVAVQNLTASVEGAELLVGQAMSNITFEYDTGAANGTSNGIPSNGTYNGNGTAWKVSTVHNTGLGKVGNTLYFMGNDGTNGWELWKSDGTDSGTEMVKDINSGQGWGMTWTSRFTPVGVGNEVYFAATDGTNGNELWKTDGTASGTVMVKNINDGSVYPYNQDSLTTTHHVCHEVRKFCLELNNEFYFSATNATNGTELWKSDGTASGTVMVKDIATQYSYSSGGPSNMVVFNNTLYFSADDGTNGIELWKSDGTASGTVMVKDINPYYGWGTEDSMPSDFVVMNDTLYFQAHTNSNGRELWKTDGTATGTVMVKDIRSGSSSSVEGNIIQRQMTLFNNTLYFQADDGTNGKELWKSDGTASGTVMVKNIRVGSASSGSTELAWFTGVGDRLYFWADDGNGHDLWKTDGTASGTVKIKDFTFDPAGSSDPTPNLQAVIGNTLYFVVDDGTSASNPGVYGSEVWKTDGTSSGTVRVTDINTGSGNAGDSHPREFTVIGTTLYFTAWDGGTNSTGQAIRHVWALDPANITGLASSITNVAGATCSISPSLQPACPSTAARAPSAVHQRWPQPTRPTRSRRSSAV